MNSVAIIGAGITGLTAAFRLKDRGIPVTVYEAGDRVGGVIRSIREKGYLAEFGPNSLLETSPKIGALIDCLGLGDRCLASLPTAQNRYLVRGKKTVLLPASPGKFLRTPLFSWRAKLRLLREPFIAPAPADVEESIAEFVLRRLGREFLDYAINPMVAGIYAGNPRGYRSNTPSQNFTRWNRNTDHLSGGRSAARQTAANGAKSPSRAPGHFPSTTACKS